MPEGWAWIWTAWHRLHADRPWTAGGMGPPIPGRIPWRDVVTWCEVQGYPAADVGFLDEVFAGLDAEWMAWWRENRPK